MTSEVSICNQALGWLGANLITSLGDDTTEGHLCRANYANLRDSVLEDRDWTFATARASLPRIVDAPPFEYSSAHQLPVDLIRLIGVWAGDYDREQIDYAKEGKVILSDRDIVNIKYIYRVEAPHDFTPGFSQALAARIAVDLALPLVQSRTLQSDMFTLYSAKLVSASANDGMQGRREEKTASIILRARR